MLTDLSLQEFSEALSPKKKHHSTINQSNILKAERSTLLEYLENARKTENEFLKRQIIENDRIDLLATEVLGYIVKPFHLKLWKWQFLHHDNLQLVFRGSGKSTTCNIVKTIHLLLKNPNLRILIASKTTSNSEAFLSEIKGHFEKNERLIEIFGHYRDPTGKCKWDNREIDVWPRTKWTKEHSVTCVGVDGTIVSKHYDVIIGDDMVDENNSSTEHMRKKTDTFYRQTLKPTLEPPDPNVPHRGEFHRLGTRFHYEDLYGTLMNGELKNHTQIIPALDENGRSPWPEKYPPEHFAKIRRDDGIIIFNAQYQCDTEAMKGKIFQYDDCQQIESSNMPDKDNLRFYMGVDLAIGEREEHDNFVIVVIALDDNKNIFVIDFFEGKLRFHAQTKKIKEYYNKYDPIKTFVEKNAYQDAQLQNLKYKNEKMRVIGKTQKKDKIIRAMKRSSDFDNKRVFFKKTAKSNLAIENLVLFPDKKGSRDFFDALDLACKAAESKTKKKQSGQFIF